MISFATTELCPYCWKSAVDMDGHGFVPTKLYLQKQMAGEVWPVGRSLPTVGILDEDSLHLTFCYY